MLRTYWCEALGCCFNWLWFGSMATCYFIPLIAVCAVFNIALFTAKDITLLMIARETECADIDGQMQHVHLLFGLATWIQVAAIGHMTIVIPLLSLAPDSLLSQSAWRPLKTEHRLEMIGPKSSLVGCPVRLSLLCQCRGLRALRGQCLVLSWCVIELIEIVLSPLFYMYWYLIMGGITEDES